MTNLCVSSLFSLTQYNNRISSNIRTVVPPHDCVIRYGRGQTTQYDLQQPSVQRGTISLRWRHLLPALLTIRTRFLPRCIAWWFACRRNQSRLLRGMRFYNLLCIHIVLLGGHVCLDAPPCVCRLHFMPFSR